MNTMDRLFMKKSKTHLANYVTIEFLSGEGKFSLKEILVSDYDYARFDVGETIHTDKIIATHNDARYLTNNEIAAIMYELRNSDFLLDPLSDSTATIITAKMKKYKNYQEAKEVAFKMAGL